MHYWRNKTCKCNLSFESVSESVVTCTAGKDNIYPNSIKMYAIMGMFWSKEDIESTTSFYCLVVHNNNCCCCCFQFVHKSYQSESHWIIYSSCTTPNQFLKIKVVCCFGRNCKKWPLCIIVHVYLCIAYMSVCTYAMQNVPKCWVSMRTTVPYVTINTLSFVPLSWVSLAVEQGNLRKCSPLH